MECSESCCRNWTSAHVAYFSAFACARWIVKANNNTAATTKGERVKGWRRNCSKGPGRIFVYLLHILGFTATTTSSRFCGRYLLCLPSLPQQWHSREPQQHNSGNNKGHSYFGASAPGSAPFWFYAAYLLIAWKLARVPLSLPLSMSLSLSLSVPVLPPAFIRLSVRVPARVRTVWLVLFLLPDFNWLPLWQFIDSFSLCVTFEMLLQCLIWMQRQIIESFLVCEYAYYSFILHSCPTTWRGICYSKTYTTIVQQLDKSEIKSPQSAQFCCSLISGDNVQLQTRCGVNCSYKFGVSVWESWGNKFIRGTLAN